MKLKDKGLNGQGLYHLGDHHEAQRHGPFATIGVFDDSIMAMFTGEKRKPKKGEWYLSGASVAAYQAKADLDTEYHIAKIVRVEKVTTYKITEDL